MQSQNLPKPNSQRRNFMKMLGAAMLCPVCADIGNAKDAKHWDYEGAAGAQNWGKLDSGFQACSIGRQQSPIDIVDPIDAKLPGLTTSYRATIDAVVNNGHTIQANMKPGSTLAVGTEQFNLLQFHFHRPSEHQIAGKSYPMEVHFVHRNAAGKLGVLGAMMAEGKPNAGFAKIAAAMPLKSGVEVKSGVDTIDYSALLPTTRTYFRYAGSLTTPPCSEEVSWMLLTDPVEVAASDVAAFAKLFRNNARPAQKTFQRFVLRSA